jgi:UDP-glucuronate 4-epimerase
LVTFELGFEIMGLEKARKRALITGGAGFVGYHTAKRLLADGWLVTSIDAITPYYDVALKRHRHGLLRQSPGFSAYEFLLEDFAQLSSAFAAVKPDIVIHLAAQAGVRYSIENPRAYIESNIVGTFNLLELVRSYRPEHFLLASTSSVYGANTKVPFSENDRTDHPTSLYAATKKSTEVMAHAYAHLWKIPTTALRFFTVYGPWGRPDMALFKFVEGIINNQPIDVFGEGHMKRDFTYIEDLVEGIVGIINLIPQTGKVYEGVDSISPVAPFRVVNIGGGKPVELLELIRIIERCLGLEASLNMMPMQAGDVRVTTADPALIEDMTHLRLSTPIEIGVKAFVEWYLHYYNLQPA